MQLGLANPFCDLRQGGSDGKKICTDRQHLYSSQLAACRVHGNLKFTR